MTIKDIAKLAGVSTATVSKVINNKAEEISEETKTKILAVINENDYVPYKKVMDRVSEKSSTIALLISDVSDIFCSELLRGVEDYFFGKEFCVIICNTDGCEEKERSYIRMLKNQNVRGIIRFPTQELSEESLQMLEHGDISSVILDDTKRAPNALKTFFNNKDGGYIATTHLIEAGHERIGYISTKTQRPYLIERFSGYQLALEENHIDFNELFVYNGDESTRKQCGYNGAKYLISQKVTAIFCSDDHVALGAYRAIQESGMKIPEDMSIIGFDDTVFCELLEPKLTSVKQSAYDIGQSSAELLFTKLNGLPLTQASVQIQPQLIERSSVCEPDSRFVSDKRRYLVIGDIRADIVMAIDSNAESAPELVNASSMQIIPGGWAVETAKALLSEKAEVFLAGHIGNDFYGQQVYRNLTENGIKMDGIVFDESKPTGTAFVTVMPDGKRNTVIYNGESREPYDYPVEQIQWIFKKADACLVDENVTAAFMQSINELCERNNVRLNDCDKNI